MPVYEITIELMVPHVDEALQFYQEVLGFELLSFKEENRMKSEVTYLDDHQIGATSIICFKVDDLEAFWA